MVVSNNDDYEDFINDFLLSQMIGFENYFDEKNFDEKKFDVLGDYDLERYLYLEEEE